MSFRSGKSGSCMTSKLFRSSRWSKRSVSAVMKAGYAPRSFTIGGARCCTRSVSSLKDISSCGAIRSASQYMSGYLEVNESSPKVSEKKCSSSDIRAEA